MEDRSTSGQLSIEGLGLTASSQMGLALRPTRREPPLSTAERQFYLSHLDILWNGKGGKAFESGVGDILYAAYDAFIDPDSYGNEGDWGCDGYVDGGKSVFACYGAGQTARVNEYLKKKVREDLKRAFDKWPMMVQWTFITNAKHPPDFLQKVWEPLKVEYSDREGRHLDLRLWGYRDVRKVLLGLTRAELDSICPGYADTADFELTDFIELLDNIVANDAAPSRDTSIDEVSTYKMDYNLIDDEGRYFLKLGMELSHVVDGFFSQHPDPGYRDYVAQRIHADYVEAVKASEDSMGALDTLYQRVGGKDFRSRGGTRRMSTYAAVAYFFQTCDIFENAPDGWVPPVGNLP